jgi:hypothetical protein
MDEPVRPTITGPGNGAQARRMAGSPGAIMTTRTASSRFESTPDVLTSDEAIVAVLQHEMHELSLLRAVFLRSRKESMDATDYGLQTSAGCPGNFHDLAWDEADKIILRMRRRGR